MGNENVAAYRQSLSTYVDALEAARANLDQDESSAASVRRLVDRLEISAGQHGFRTVQTAARAVQAADRAALAGAIDQLLYALLNAVSVDAARETTVVIVDDDPVFNRLLQKILAKAGRHLEVVERGRDLPNVFRQRWVDLIILDIGLPDLDGREILAALRKNPITARIPIMILSAKDEPWAEAECLALGADRFVSKPIEPAALQAVVAELLEPRPEAAPAAAATAQPATPTSEPAAAQDGPREVLLAEHDPLTSQIIRHRLGREGYTVRHFTSGTAALQAAKSLAPTVVIVDAMTPGIDGIELVGKLRQLPSYRTTPILVLSDIGSEREVVRALEAGADDCVRKPFSPTELAARVERLLKRT